MRVARFSRDGILAYGIVDEDQLVVLDGHPLLNDYKTTGERLPLASVKLVAPTLPSKVVCVGLNYAEHAAEAGLDVPAEPALFLKPSSSVVGNGEAIVWPSQTERVDMEVELAIVIGAVAKNVTERFGMAKWSFSLTATDANRWAIRLVRAITGKPKILFNAYCYHGSVDEALIVVGPDGEGMSRPGNVGSPVDVTETSRVAEFNDLEGLERQLKNGDVAAVLMEPALTNIGIVLPEPGYLAGVRELTRKYDALLIIDETHTFSAGWGGMTKRDELEPDVFVIGKAIAGGIPTGTYGLSESFAARVLERTDLDLVDMGGVGGTLAGNPLQVAAMRATLEKVLTPENFSAMIDLATYFTDGVNALFEKYQLPWAINQLGARAEYRFAKPYPITGTAAYESADGELEDFLHLYLANRGILLTPFHNMALMCPSTTKADVDRHQEVFEEAIRELLAV